jgi:hypothetical protein
MRRVEHAIDIWDLTGLDRRLNAGMLRDHLRDFEREGWELVWMALDVELADLRRPSHVLVLKRVFEE